MRVTLASVQDSGTGWLFYLRQSSMKYLNFLFLCINIYIHNPQQPSPHFSSFVGQNELLFLRFRENRLLRALDPSSSCLLQDPVPTVTGLLSSFFTLLFSIGSFPSVGTQAYTAFLPSAYLRHFFTCHSNLSWLITCYPSKSTEAARNKPIRDQS